jgi:nuclear transport factor 2 (NTF2) superfamily protein
LEVQSVSTQEEGLTPEVAAEFLREAEAAFGSADVERIVSAFHPDIVIRYGGFPEIQGVDAAREWLTARFTRQQNYTLKKTLRTVTGNVLGGSWEGEWDDAKTGERMKGLGLEFQTLENGQVTNWLAVLSTWPASEGPTSSLV